MAITRRLPRLPGPTHVDLRRLHPGPGPADGWDELDDYQPMRLRRWLVVLAAGYLALLGWVATHGPGPGLLSVSAPGYVTLLLAAVLVVVLLVHRAAGGLRHLLRVLAEYAIVALLAVLLATIGAGPGPGSAPAPPAARPPAPAHVHATPGPGPSGTGAGSGKAQPSASAVDRLRALVAGWWQHLDQAAGRHPPTPPPPTTTITKPKEG